MSMFRSDFLYLGTEMTVRECRHIRRWGEWFQHFIIWLEFGLCFLCNILIFPTHPHSHFYIILNFHGISNFRSFSGFSNILGNSQNKDFLFGFYRFSYKSWWRQSAILSEIPLAGRDCLDVLPSVAFPEILVPISVWVNHSQKKTAGISDCHPTGQDGNAFFCVDLHFYICLHFVHVLPCNFSPLPQEKQERRRGSVSGSGWGPPRRCTSGPSWSTSEPSPGPDRIARGVSDFSPPPNKFVCFIFQNFFGFLIIDWSNFIFVDIRYLFTIDWCFLWICIW